MKTFTEAKFDTIIKEGFHEILKPLGFKKKVNNFYLQLQDLGQIINIQRSSFNSKEHINFTINTGIFIPEYWLAYYNFHNGVVPTFPTEPACAIRQRIGKLKYKGYDKWFDVNTETNVSDLMEELKDCVLNYILTYFNSINNKAAVLQILGDKTVSMETFGRLIIYGEYKEFAKAQAEYERLLNDRYTNFNFKDSLNEYKAKYGLQN